MPHDRLELRNRLAAQIRHPMAELVQMLDRLARGPMTTGQGEVVDEARRTAQNLAVAVSDLLDLCCVEGVSAEPGAPDPEDDRWIDPDVTRRLRILDRPGRPGVLGRLVGVWADRSLGDLNALGAAARTGATERATRIASSWRGASQNLGAMVLARELAAVEADAKRGRLPTDEELARLGEIHAATLEALLRRVAEEARWTPHRDYSSSPLSLRSAS